MVPVSVIDLCPSQGSDAATALRHSLDLAQHAEHWGYSASGRRAPQHADRWRGDGRRDRAVAAGTRSIRVGAGGIMLPNHAPLIIAEQFGTLESLFPGRIDLGLGRAPGTDQRTAHALRRTLASDPDAFPHDVLELLSYFQPDDGQAVRAVPGTGLNIPLPSRPGLSAQVAPRSACRSFALHFAAAQMIPAVDRIGRFKSPVAQIDRPYVILGVNIVAAGTDDEARLLASSGRQAFTSLRAGTPIPLPPPSREWEKAVEPFDPAHIGTLPSISMVGSAGTVRDGMAAFVDRMQPDELIVVSHIYDHAARLRSHEITADIAREVNRLEKSGKT
jgi:luciferase family oxidoreductase group 1